MAITPIAPGYVDMASNSTARYIPEVWSSKLVPKYYAATVFGEITTKEFEGEIKSLGDNIIIRSVPDVIVSDYQIGMGFTDADYQRPVSAAITLPIDKAKKFTVAVNSVHKHQSDLDLIDIYSTEATTQIQIEMDRDMLEAVPAEAATLNQGAAAGALSGTINLGTDGSPLAVNSSNAVDVVLDVAQAMDEQNLPRDGRWIVLPAWYVRKVFGSDLKQADITGDTTSILRNGRVGTIANMTIYQSNNLDGTGANSSNYTNIIAGHTGAIAWASQFVEVERHWNPADFGEILRGLCIYGYKVINPNLLFHVRAHVTAEA